MELDHKLKVCICLSVLLIIEVHTAPHQNIQDEEATSTLHIPLTYGHTGNSLRKYTHVLSKRSNDWSQREPNRADSVHTTDKIEEHGNKTQKIPRIVRKYKLKKDNMQNNTKFMPQESNHDSKMQEGGRRLVRVRKFRKKTSKSTSNTPISTTTMPSKAPAIRSATTEKSSFAHITVINREERTQKPNRKNKYKKQRNEWIPTTPFGNIAKQNGLSFVTVLPDIRQVIVLPQEVRRVNIPVSLQRNSEYAAMRRALPSTRFRSRNGLGANPRPPQQTNLDDQYDTYDDPVTVKTANIPSEQIRQKPQDAAITVVSSRKHSAPFNSICCSPHLLEKLQKAKASVHTTISPHYATIAKERLLVQTEKPVTHPSNFQTIATEKHKHLETTTDKPQEITVHPFPEVPEQRSGDTYVTNVKPPNRLPPSVTPQKKANRTLTPPANPLPRHSTQPIFTPGRTFHNMKVPPPRFPLPVSRNYFGQDMTFMNPFLQPGLQSPNLFRSPQRASFMPPSYSFSPFFAPQSEELFFPDQMQAFQADEMLFDGFHHSPHLRSLRRSIVDDFSDEETTTVDPSPPYTIPSYTMPKFEVPSIDFNDKGCKTVYKEVDAGPLKDANVTNKQNKAKSYVITRECVFPNGVPTVAPNENKNSTVIAPNNEGTTIGS